VEGELAAGLGEGELAELIEHCEVEPGQVVCDASLLSSAVLGLEPIDHSTTLKKRPRAPLPPMRTALR